MLAHVVVWNSGHVGAAYDDLMRLSAEPAGDRSDPRPGHGLAARLDKLARDAGLPGTLREIGVPREDIPALAAEAAAQWTGTFNPRPFDAAGARELYERAY